MGLSVGEGAKRFIVGETAVVPNICIETAVERVTIDQISRLVDRGESADVVVTVTNDGWFDDSSVIAHHLRCAQLVAVGCRRPVLSAANNGPTAWIDSRGRLVQQLARGTDGAIIATPHRDGRQTLYLRIGDWPARCLALVCVVVLVEAILRRRRAAEGPTDPSSIP
jgi:apolipoprotein N-acyltransferase